MNLWVCKFDKDKNTLTAQHESGLGYLCVHTLYDLIEVYKNHITDKPIHINWTSKWWNKPDQQSRNVFKLYFKQTEATALPKFDSNMFISKEHYVMQKIRFELLKPIRDLHFQLSDDVLVREKIFREKYQIDTQKIVVGYYRGTDKRTEVPSVDPSIYLMCIEGILRDEPDCKVLIQTDQSQVLKYFRNKLGDRMFNIEEMPTTDGDVVMHHNIDKSINNYELGINYLAVLSLISKCKHIVIDTGGGAWLIHMFRGNAKNVWEIWCGKTGNFEIYKTGDL